MHTKELNKILGRILSRPEHRRNRKELAIVELAQRLSGLTRALHAQGQPVNVLGQESDHACAPEAQVDASQSPGD